MCFINQICDLRWEKSYLYFNAEHQPQIEILNIFERILRKVVGWYSHTHLTTVVDHGYKASFLTSVSWTPVDRQTWLNLLAKDKRTPDGTYAERGNRFQLPSYVLDGDKSVELSIEYQLECPPESTDAKISAIVLQLVMQPSDSYQLIIEKKSSRISISEAGSGGLLFGIEDRKLNYSRSMETMHQSFASPGTTVINHLIAKIITDSQELPEIESHLFSYEHATDVPNASDATRIQHAHMQRLGWEKVNRTMRNRIGTPQLTYQMKKSAAAPIADSTRAPTIHDLSLDFALTALKDQDTLIITADL